MKKMIIGLFLLSCVSIFAQPSLAQQKQHLDPQILAESQKQAAVLLNAQRKIAQEARTAQAVVTITFTWVKSSASREFAPYPSRGAIHKSQEGTTVKTKSTQCKGILLENDKVATPEVCTRQKGWQLDKMTLAFADGTETEKNADALEIAQDIVYIGVADVTGKGVRGLPFSLIPADKNILTYFNDDQIEEALTSFLLSKGVLKRAYFGSKRYRSKIRRHLSRIELGDAFVYQGRVVALVKKKVNWYSALPAEHALALFRP